MKNNIIKIKNELPELLTAICNHPDCEEWLKEGITRVISEKETGVIYTLNYFRAAFESIAVGSEAEANYYASKEASDLEVIQ